MKINKLFVDVPVIGPKGEGQIIMKVNPLQVAFLQPMLMEGPLAGPDGSKMKVPCSGMMYGQQMFPTKMPIEELEMLLNTAISAFYYPEKKEHIPFEDNDA